MNPLTPMIKMIALDLDGTLALDNHEVSPPTRDALDDLHQNGVQVVIATGRRYRTTRYVIENLGFEVFAICNGGALVKAPDQSTVHVESFSLQPFLQICRDLKLTLFAQRDAHQHGGADFVLDTIPAWNEQTHRHVENNRDWCEARDLGESDSEFMVAGCFGTEAQLTQLADTIAAEHSGAYNTIIVPHIDSDWFYCEVSPIHVDKWEGLKKILPEFNLTAENVCTVGDQLNDMAMITKAGHGAAMENGHPDLQAAADFICGHNQNDGILDVVNYIQTHNNRGQA